MASLPSNNTGVLFLDYSTCLENHTAQVRFGDAGTPADCMIVLDEMLTAMVAFLYQVDIIGARVRLEGENVTNPVTWTGDASYGGDPGPHYGTAQFVDFVGRSGDGRRVRMEFFGAQAYFDGGGDDYRFQSADFPFVANCLASLTSKTGCAVSISGLSVSWKSYGNGGVNAYWRNRVR